MIDGSDTLQQAAARLAALDSDYAAEENSVGFSKPDTWAGHALAATPAEHWTQDIYDYAHGLLWRYHRTQLADLDWDSVPRPSTDQADRREARGQLWQRLQAERARSSLRARLLADGTALVTFEFDRDLVDSLKAEVDGRHFVRYPDTGWLIPPRSFWSLARWCVEHGAQVDEPLLAVFDAVEDEPRPEPLPSRRIELDGAQVTIWFEFDRDEVARVKQAGARFQRTPEPHWTLPLAKAAPVLAFADRGYLLPDGLADAISGAAEQRDRLLVASSALDADTDLPGFDGLYPFQKAGVRYALQTRRVIIGDSMGLGKTLQALATVGVAEAFPALIVCPALVKLNWAAEIRKWCPSGREALILSGQPKGDVMEGLLSALALHDQKRQERREHGAHVLLASDVPAEQLVPTVRARDAVDAPPAGGEYAHDAFMGVAHVDAPQPRATVAALDAPFAVEYASQVGEGNGIAGHRDGCPGCVAPDSRPPEIVGDRAAAASGLLRDFFVGQPRDLKIEDLPRELWAAALHVAPLVVVNYDIISHWLPALSALGFRALIMDEAQALKNSKARRTRAVASLAKLSSVEYVVALTGTPVLNRPIELASPLDILGVLKPEFGGFWPFARRFANAHQNRFGWDLSGASNLDELHRRLRETCYVRREKADVLPELPAKTRMTVELPLTDRSSYEAALGRTVDWLDDNPAQNPLAEITRLRVETARLKLPSVVEWVTEFLDASDEKLIVFAHHVETQTALLDSFPGASRILGADSTAVRDEQVHRFQTDPGCRLMVASIGAGGVGVTLTAASHVAFAELPWRPGDVDQAEDRAYGRLNDPHPVNSYFLLGEGTIDQWMADLIDSKRAVVDRVTSGEEGASGEGILEGLVQRLRESRAALAV